MLTKPAPKKPTNLSLDQDLIEQAKELGINLSKAAETGLAHAVKCEKELAWKQDNAAAIESSNDWVENHGLPLEKYRQF